MDTHKADHLHSSPVLSPVWLNDIIAVALLNLKGMS